MYRTDNNIKRVKYVTHGGSSAHIKDELWLAATPITIVSNKIDYRVIPMYKDIAVSATGVVIDANTSSVCKQYAVHGYRAVLAHDYVNARTHRVLVHRLVAMAWCDNDDYVKKNIVDHIDGCCNNNAATNLRWVSNSDNIASGKNSGLSQFVAINIGTGLRMYKSTLKAIAAYLGVPNTNLSKRRLPQLINTANGDTLVTATDNTDTFIDDYLRTKYAFSVTKVNGRGTDYFRTKTEIRDAYNVGCYPLTVANLRKKLLALGYKLHDHNNVSVANRYDVMNLLTGDERRGLDMSGVVEVTGVPRGTVISRCNRKYRYGAPMGEWVLKFNSVPNYETVELATKRIYIVTPADGGAPSVYESLRELSRCIGVNRETIRSCISNNKLCNGNTISVAITHLTAGNPGN